MRCAADVKKLLLRSAFENIPVQEEMKIVDCGKLDEEDNLCRKIDRFVKADYYPRKDRLFT